MSLKPRRLTRAIRYRIDGLGDGHQHPCWTYAGHACGVVTFHGTGREQIVLDVRRLYEVRPGHLHYASAD